MLPTRGVDHTRKGERERERERERENTNERKGGVTVTVGEAAREGGRVREEEGD